MLIDISPGELLDKYTILKIKLLKIKDKEKQNNIKNEYNYIRKQIPIEIRDSGELQHLLTINKEIWVLEDKIRKKEKIKKFDLEFIELARSIYKTNDERASIKKKINQYYGKDSDFMEEKEYVKY